MLSFGYALGLLALKWAVAPRYGVDVSALGFGDCLGALLMGQESHRVAPGALYFPPLDWVLLCALCGVPAVSASALRQSGLEDQAVMRGGSRTAWSLSGAVWACIAAGSWWVSLMAASALWCVAHGAPLDPFLHQDVMLFLLNGDQLGAWGTGAGPAFFAGAVLASTAVAQLVRLVAEVWGAGAGVIAPVALMIASDYAQTPLLPGNLMALVRWEDAAPGGVPWAPSAACAGALIVACVAVSALRDVRRDMLRGEDL